ncbi:prepilin-type N-terminal cleavage/methylation domain-containing protein [Zobellella maritima]|uniref:prepilin-type N-terminal cleavage/methylation domain-containing protein n=1 Tax=Zobellella maritima TaxID=2059725 RepID=UPI000E2FFCBF|nr:prepilin-type N-terminal cleavage/methylation domain-containing protein [Zobellella maritima]
MKKPRGFTLLELMVALMLLTLLAGLIFSGFRLASRTWETVNTHSVTISEGVQVQHFLRRQLEQAISMDIWDPADNQLLSFQGTESELIFLAPLPQQLLTSRPSASVAQNAWFYLALDETDPQRPLLQLKTQPFGQNENEQSVDWALLQSDFRTQGLIAPLLTLSVDGLTLSYRAKETDTPPDWQQEWLNEDRLPELILLQMEDDREQGVWPALMVTPRNNVYETKDDF